MPTRQKCVSRANKFSRTSEIKTPLNQNKNSHNQKIMKALQLLLKTNDSFARLTLGLVMFPHGAQKALG